MGRRPFFSHLEHADLGGRAEPVLDPRAHAWLTQIAGDAKHQRGIAGMLEVHGTADVAILVDVGYDHDHDAGVLGETSSRPGRTPSPGSPDPGSPDSSDDRIVWIESTTTIRACSRRACHRIPSRSVSRTS